MSTPSGCRSSRTIRTSPRSPAASRRCSSSGRRSTGFCCAAMGCTLGATICRGRDGTWRFSSSCSKRPDACRRLREAAMALVRIPERQQTIDGMEAVSNFLATYGITYERWESKRQVPADATADAVLQAYGDKVDELKARGGYTTADVIDVNPATPNLDAMLAKFSIEHWHDEDEVRFI